MENGRKNRIYEAGTGVNPRFWADGCGTVREEAAARVLAWLLVRTVWHRDCCLWRVRFSISEPKIFRVAIIRADLRMDTLRSCPRFQELLRRIRLPQ